MLQVVHMDVAKVDQDVTFVASVSKTCRKLLFKMFHLFINVCCKCFGLDVAYVSHICSKYFSHFSLMLQ
jgi:hypothetical protein